MYLVHEGSYCFYYQFLNHLLSITNSSTIPFICLAFACGTFNVVVVIISLQSITCTLILDLKAQFAALEITWEALISAMCIFTPRWKLSLLLEKLPENHVLFTPRWLHIEILIFNISFWYVMGNHKWISCTKGGLATSYHFKIHPNWFTCTCSAITGKN